MRRQSGQTATEYMLVISVIVVSVVGSSYAFVPRFQQGVNHLGGNVRDILSTGSFAGLGLNGITVHDTAVNDSTIIEGGTDIGNNGTSQQVSRALASIPFLSGMAPGIEKGIQENQLAAQRANGGAPPTGIDGNPCGLWALSYIMNDLGVDGGDLHTLMDLAKSTPAILISDDYRIDRFGMDWLAEDLKLDSQKTYGKDFPTSKTWLDSQVQDGKKPAVLVTKNGLPHWMVVTGTTKDDTGRVTGYTFQDSTTDAPQTMSAQEFQNSWAQQGNVGISFTNAGAAPVASK